MGQVQQVAQHAAAALLPPTADPRHAAYNGDADTRVTAHRGFGCKVPGNGDASVEPLGRLHRGIVEPLLHVAHPVGGRSHRGVVLRGVLNEPVLERVDVERTEQDVLAFGQHLESVAALGQERVDRHTV